MAASAEFTEFVMELLEPISALAKARFFGGVGISHDSIQFAMIMGNSLYFVDDDETRPKYEALGKEPFSYMTKKGRVHVGRYHEVPEEMVEEPEMLLSWARESITVARRTSKKR